MTVENSGVRSVLEKCIFEEEGAGEEAEEEEKQAKKKGAI